MWSQYSQPLKDFTHDARTDDEVSVQFLVSIDVVLPKHFSLKNCWWV